MVRAMESFQKVHCELLLFHSKDQVSSLLTPALSSNPYMFIDHQLVVTQGGYSEASSRGSARSQGTRSQSSQQGVQISPRTACAQWQRA